MADLYIGFNVGADYSPDKATVGSSTGSTDVEVRIDLTKLDGKTKTRLDVNLILEAVERVINDGRTATLLG